MSKKGYIAAALGIASVWLASLFVSNTILAQSNGAYDPWLDYNEDGVIDVNDLSPLGDAYGSQGDSTKNVSVTNWPEPEKPTFAETLILRGTRHVLYNQWGPVFEYDEFTRLIAEGSLYPPVVVDRTKLCGAVSIPSVWTLGEVWNFTHDTYPQKPYFIRGDVIIRPTLEYYFENPNLLYADNAYINVTVYFEKVGSDDISTILASDTMSAWVNVPADSYSVGNMSQIGLTFKFPEAVWIEGERLRIRLETWFCCELGLLSPGTVWLLHAMGTDEFIAYIPIYQP